MKTVQFNSQDAYILYTIPKPPVSFADVVRSYTFVNRDAAPTYDEFTGCLNKALKAGILREENGGIVVDNGWYDKIHASDETTNNEIDSMLEFEDRFVNVPLPEVTTGEIALSRDDYHSILISLKKAGWMVGRKE